MNMILKDKLYKILDATETPEGVSYDISLRGEHPIYQAHLPGKPITPGICIIQIVQELLADHLHRNLSTSSIKNAKFLSILEPTGKTIVVHLSKIEQTGDKIAVQSMIVDSQNTIYARISLTCDNT